MRLLERSLRMGASSSTTRIRCCVIYLDPFGPFRGLVRRLHAIKVRWSQARCPHPGYACSERLSAPGCASEGRLSRVQDSADEVSWEGDGWGGAAAQAAGKDRR